MNTPAHPFYVKDTGFIKAGDLEEGAVFVDNEGNELHLLIKKWEHLQSPVPVYNFAVEDYHTYFVGSAKVLVHNMCSSAQSMRPEASITGSKKHGINWTEGPARAIKTGMPQGQWAESDLEFATEMAKTLGPKESAIFDLPKTARSIVHMPDGQVLKATRAWIRNNGFGTWHGYPLP